MAECTGSTNALGKNVILQFLESCGDTDPTLAPELFKVIVSVNQKDVNIGTTTTDITSDDTGSVQASLVTYLTFTATVAGFATTSDNALVNQAFLKKYLVNEIVAGRQPTVWVRAIFADVTYYAFCNLSTSSNGASSTEAVSFNFEFVATATPLGSGVAPIMILDTVTA